MSMPMARRLAVGGALVALALVFPTSAAATITGGCTGEGHSTSSSANLTTDTIWHLKRDDVAGGSGSSPAAMHRASVSAYGLGLGLPIAGGTSESGETSGSLDGVQVSTYAVLGRQFVVAGSASGDAQCTGQILIIIDDVQAVFTVLGGGGIILGILGLLGMLLFARGERGFANRLVSAFLGALAGVGLGLAAEQFDLLDPTRPIGLFLVIGLAVVGFLTAGMLGPRGAQPLAPA
ncbi:MAG: hypothetical protein E6I65_05415 [Chloroflexi bacterium]|nr:MAG: hypothetical protein E6I65_05415 [Chloroflexota bacterium]